MNATRAVLLAALVVAAACKGEQASPAPKNDEPAAAPAATAPAPTPAAAPPDAAPAAAPIPTDPKERDLARKTAILEGRYDEAVRLCDAEDLAKLGEQDVLACVLSACRQSDGERAAAWGKRLKGPLKTEAKKVCAASGTAI